jgi:hypothetical protein
VEVIVSPEVPARAERARRITRLLLQADVGPALLFMTRSNVQRLFGLGWVTGSLIDALFICWMIHVYVSIRRDRQRHGRVQYRTSPGSISPTRWWRYYFTIWAAFCARLLVDVIGVEGPGSGATVLLFLPPVVPLFLAWWWEGWWPRLVLLGAAGVALLALPVWMPVAEKRLDLLAVFPVLALLAWELIDHLELRKLLRETDREIHGESVSSEGGRT